MYLYDYNKTIFFINLIYEIPSFTLLLIVEIVLLLPKNKKAFQSSFFKMIFFNGIFDIISFIIFTFHHRLPNYGIFIDFYKYLSDINFDVRIIEFIRSFLSVAQLIGTFFLCLNRFTSIIFRLQYGCIWKYLLPLYYIIIITLPAIFTFPILFDKMIYKPFNSSNINIGFKGRWVTFNADWYNSYIISMILSLIFLTSCAIINFATFLLLLKYKKNTSIKVCGNNSHKNINYSMEKKFFILAVTCFCGQIILVTSHFVVNEFSRKKLYEQFYIMTLLFPVINDITIFPNNWLLVFISSNIRCSIKELFCIKNKEVLSNIKTPHTHKKNNI
uniref:Serpentine receptor class gamma n=1 Tax=Strongyloides stercoralis TaxID=6248 RepID=A0A0K0ECW2_STRER